jgi:hypothetical protein
VGASRRTIRLGLTEASYAEDTRAAHLERSRIKAALQRLSMRVHYQRLAAMNGGSGKQKPRRLNDFFSAVTSS